MTQNPSPLAATQATAAASHLSARCATIFGRFPYRPITDADPFRWPNGARLAVYLGFNIEHFALGEGRAPTSGRSPRSRTCSTTAGASTATV